MEIFVRIKTFPEKLKVDVEIIQEEIEEEEEEDQSCVEARRSERLAAKRARNQTQSWPKVSTDPRAMV